MRSVTSKYLYPVTELNVTILLSILFHIVFLFSPINALAFGYKNTPVVVDNIDLAEMTIEELMEVEFVTIQKKPSSILNTPAAVVIMDDNTITQTGSVLLPEAFRVLPGIQVAQHNANSWSVTSRGFSGLSRGITGHFANKLLVLSDGRSIYTPLFSGVTWAIQDVMLEDVKRIEVIRGPGASLWGANAMNGIINILSRTSDETQGGLLSTGTGTEKKAMFHFRYGGQINQNIFYRVYGKYFNHDDSYDTEKSPANDGWFSAKSGFRFDAYHLQSQFTAQGEIYNCDISQKYNTIFSQSSPILFDQNHEDVISGGFILGRWHKQISRDSDHTLQIYFDRVNRNEAIVKGKINTLDIDFQQRFPLARRQELIWGAGVRFINDKFDSTFNFYLTPARRNYNVINAFIQDEFQIVDSRLALTIGSKFEHNSFTGIEAQPSLKILWTPNQSSSVWAALSRAVRTPSRGEIDGNIIFHEETHPTGSNTPNIPDSITTFFIYRGSKDYKSENLMAYELGYRSYLQNNFYLDLAAFYNRYGNLRTDELEEFTIPTDPIPEFLNFYQHPGNNMKGFTYGFELTSDWHLNNIIEMRSIYSYIEMELISKKDKISPNIVGQSPKHMFTFMTSLQPSKKVMLSTQIRYIDNLKSQDVPAYITADANFTWRFSSNLTLSLVGQNLLSKNHKESNQYFLKNDPLTVTRTRATYIERGFYSKIIYRF